ncbi:hypothetical protein [Methylobacterium sp. ID0610]|uniref:hypothetical protein n=1 Tax=Methylobacterium carpenticola TaxID=3344827 RepID=UPI0036B61149
MTNVIRPNFRSNRPVSATLIFDILHVYGEVNDCRVLLIKDCDEPEGETYKIAVDDSRYREVDIVSMMPFTDNGRLVSDLIGEAIVRTLHAKERNRSGSTSPEE